MSIIIYIQSEKNGRGSLVSINIGLLNNIKYDIIENLCYSNNICEITIKILSNNSNIIVSGTYYS